MVDFITVAGVEMKDGTWYNPEKSNPAKNMLNLVMDNSAILV